MSSWWHDVALVLACGAPLPGHRPDSDRRSRGGGSTACNTRSMSLDAAIRAGLWGRADPDRQKLLNV